MLSEMSTYVRSPLVDVVASAICVGVNPRYSTCWMNEAARRVQQTSGREVLLEVGDPVAVQRVDRRRVQIIRRHVAKDAVKAEIGENSVRQTRAEYRVHVRYQIGPYASPGGRGRR